MGDRIEPVGGVSWYGVLYWLVLGDFGVKSGLAQQPSLYYPLPPNYVYSFQFNTPSIWDSLRTELSLSSVHYYFKSSSLESMIHCH
jgi:hypothetical protein